MPYFYTKIKFNRTSSPTGSVTFSRDPTIPNYKRKTQFMQPKDFSDGGEPYIYNKGIHKHYRTLVFTDISVTELANFMTFLESVAMGSLNTFDFTDRDGTIYSGTRIWNSDDIISTPQYANLEALEIELLLG